MKRDSFIVAQLALHHYDLIENTYISLVIDCSSSISLTALFLSKTNIHFMNELQYELNISHYYEKSSFHLEVVLKKNMNRILVPVNFSISSTGLNFSDSKIIKRNFCRTCD